MSSYYFPFGATSAATIQNISHSLRATTASVPYSVTTAVLTASYAIDSGSTPPIGANGVNITIDNCVLSLYISGSQGNKGNRGPKGTDNNTCPTGTIECPDLLPSLSMALPGFPNGINFVRPSGSKFSKVCMEIPVGCTSVTATCPSYLPTASITSTFPQT